MGKVEIDRVCQGAESGRGMTRREYLMGELRCASLRARLQVQDIEAVGMALGAGLIQPEQALELLADCDCLQFISPDN
jgi:hypothetical protein